MAIVIAVLFKGSWAWRNFCLTNISGFKYTTLLFFLMCNINSIGELPVTIDFKRFDCAPGIHNITIVANSTMGEMAEFTNIFFVPGTVCISDLYFNYS